MEKSDNFGSVSNQFGLEWVFTSMR